MRATCYFRSHPKTNTFQGLRIVLISNQPLSRFSARKLRATVAFFDIPWKDNIIPEEDSVP